MLSCAAMLLTATCGSTAPRISAISTRRAAAFTPVSVITGWRASGASLMPAVTTAPPGASATPETSCAAAVPNGRAWCQVRPSAETNAVRLRAAWPVTPVSPASTAPSGPPLAIRAVNPAGAPRVARNVQARPFGEEKTSTAGRLATVPGGRAGYRRPGRAAVGAQPGDTDLDRRGPPRPGGHGVPGDQDQLAGRRHGRDVQGVAVTRGQAQPGRVEPIPAGPVGRQEDQRSGFSLVSAGDAGAHGDEPVGRPGHRVDPVTGA